MPNMNAPNITNQAITHIDVHIDDVEVYLRCVRKLMIMSRIILITIFGVCVCSLTYTSKPSVMEASSSTSRLRVVVVPTSSSACRW